jgi:hypothetical protein
MPSVDLEWVSTIGSSGAIRERMLEASAQKMRFIGAAIAADAEEAAVRLSQGRAKSVEFSARALGHRPPIDIRLRAIPAHEGARINLMILIHGRRQYTITPSNKFLKIDDGMGAARNGATYAKQVTIPAKEGMGDFMRSAMRSAIGRARSHV